MWGVLATGQSCQYLRSQPHAGQRHYGGALGAMTSLKDRTDIAANGRRQSEITPKAEYLPRPSLNYVVFSNRRLSLAYRLAYQSVGASLVSHFHHHHHPTPTVDLWGGPSSPKFAREAASTAKCASLQVPAERALGRQPRGGGGTGVKDTDGGFIRTPNETPSNQRGSGPRGAAWRGHVGQAVAVSAV